MARANSDATTARSLAAATLVFLFLAEAQRALFGSLFGLVYDAVFPAFDAGATMLALLPFVAQFAPLLPVARWIDGKAAVAIAAAGVAVFRLPMTAPGLATRAIFSTLVLACAALFLTWAVGYLADRALAGGAVLGLVIDQLLRLAGVSYDLSLRPGWLPAQAVLSLGLLGLAFAWIRDDERETETGRGLERRAGGVRLRGGIALGALLFLDLHVLGLPPVIARWSRVSWETATIAAAAAGAVALGVVFSSLVATRSRNVSLALLAAVAVAVFSGWWTAGLGPAVLMAVGHGAALVLIARTLAPASGRRGGLVLTISMLLFVGLTALYGMTFFHAFTLPALQGGAPWIFGAALLVLAGALVLLPQPPSSTALARPVVAGVAAVGVGVLAVLVTTVVVPNAPAPAHTRPTTGEVTDVPPFRVATYNVHYGFDEAWTFDPAAIAAIIEEAGPALVALQEVPAGMPAAYGVDLSLWLERRVGLPAFFSATENGLLGEALLATLPTRQVDAAPLPPERGDRKQLLRLHAVLGGRSVVFYALHLGLDEGERTGQIGVAMDHIGSTWAVVLGDFNEGPDGPVAAALRAAGFVDAFAAAGAVPSPTAPATRPRDRIDWIWLHGLEAEDARVLAASPSDHRLVVATLKLPTP